MADDAGGLVTQGHRCGEIRFRVGLDVVPGEAAGLLGVLGTQAQGEWVTIPKGTRLYWEDGTDAGVASRDHSVQADQLRGDTRRCVDVEVVNALRGMTATTVALCAQPGDWVAP